MAQMLLIGITWVQASDVNLDLEIKNHVEEILKSSFENVSRSYFNGNPLRNGMDYMIHGINKPNAQAMQLSCVWESMQHASSRIQAEVPDTTGLDSFMKSHCSQLSHSKCRSNSFQPLYCDENNPYRSIDGTCNNINNPRLGSANQPFGRYREADYGDGVGSPRTGKRYTRLPNAREVSNIMAKAEPRSKPDVSVMFMQWGQFLSHDITFTSGMMDKDCCTNDKMHKYGKSLDEACIPIDVRDDPYYRRFHVECLKFVRSRPCTKGCSFGKREQVNENTAFVDASQVYGSSAEEADKLRTKSGGQLNITDNVFTHKPMPPFGNIPNVPKLECRFAEPEKCFLAGDARIDMVPGLIAMHTAFIRLHNILATELQSLNAHWTDEKIYQEARRIVGALVQQITYREWLPILLGPKVMAEKKLKVEIYGYKDTYIPNEDPTVKNVFSAAAF
ncbi:unnamed protein product, partial [Meganyctiphanes norvegica]